jgi:cobaltochelatase CobN
VAIQKDFWKADEKTQKELALKFANNIIEHGIPGSGHTHANHPIYDFVKSKIDEQTASKLEEVLSQSRMEKVDKKQNATSIQEVKLDNQQNKENQEISENKESKNSKEDDNSYMKYLLLCAFLILLVGLAKSVFFNKIKKGA